MKRVKNDVRDITDETLALARSGNTEATTRVLKTVEGLVRWRAKHYRVDLDTYEDLMSLGRMAVLDAVRTWRPGKATFVAWMTQWVHARMWAHAKKAMKREKYTRDFAREVVERPANADVQLATDAQHTELRGAIAKLPTRLRMVMRGRLEGKTLADIGRDVDLSRERVRQLEALALERLRRTMEAA